MNFFKSKTNIVGLIGILILLGLVVALIFGKIDGTTFATAASTVATFLGGMLILGANDKKTS